MIYVQSKTTKIYNLYNLYYFRNIEQLDSKFSDESDELEEGICGPEKAYRGPHINFPLQKKDIDTLIDFFRKKKVYIYLINIKYKIIYLSNISAYIV